MNPLLKIHLVSLIYCAMLWALNWFKTTVYTGATHSYREENVMVGWAFLLSGLVAAVMAVACLRKARSRLESGSQVAEGKWIQTYLPILYALPLLFRASVSTTSIAGGGATTVLTQGYGHALSTWVFLFAIAGMLLWQVAIRLHGDPSNPRLVPADRGWIRTYAG